MSTINQLSSGTQPALTASTGKAQMGKEDFLKLLVAQLSHQDPLKPQDGAAFVAELAQFSTLEQMLGVNTRLDSIAQTSASARDGQAFGLIGKHVTASTAKVSVDPFAASAINFSLPEAASETKVSIVDGNGNTVRTIDAGALVLGKQSLSWDGLSDDGTRLPSGDYRVSVTARDANGKAITPTLEVTDLVSGVSFSGGQTILDVGGARVALTDVRAIK